MATGRTDGITDANSDSDNQGDKAALTSKDVDTASAPVLSDSMTASIGSLGSPRLESSQILEEKQSAHHNSPASVKPSLTSPASMKPGLGRYSPHVGLSRPRSLSKGTSSPLRVASIPSGFPPPNLGLDHSLISIQPPGRPIEARSVKDYINLETLKHEGGHVVSKVVEVSDTEIQFGYLKHNTPGSFISQLEAMCAAFYRLIAPDHAPDVYAVYEERSGVEVYTGVVSHEMVGFKSAASDPLKDEDLNVDHLADRNLFPVLDDFDDQMRLLEKAAEAYDRQLKKLEQNEQQLQARLLQLRATGVAAHAAEIDSVKKKFRANSERKMNLFDELAENTRKQHELYSNLEKDHQVSKTEFERYRIVKGLAIGTTASYIFVEVDLHQNNMSKDGKRIDFDMSLWHLFWEFKDSRIIDFFASKKPARNVLDVTRNDLRNFPDLKDISPYYWPTISDTILSEAQREFIKNFIPFAADNPYSVEANARYKKLAKNKVFIYHKFATLLKYVLTSADMYRHIAQLHVSKDSYSQSKSLMESVVLGQAQRIQLIKDRLLSMPEFSAFMAEQGDTLFERIKDSFLQQNEEYEEKVSALQAQLADLQLQHDTLTEMNTSLLSKSTESLPNAPVHTETPTIIVEYSNNLSTIDTRELKQAREEQRLQFDRFEKNELELKKIADQMNRLEARIVAYGRQKIDLEYVALMYKNMSARSKAALENEQQGVRTERANSLSGSAATTPVSTPKQTPTSSATPKMGIHLPPPVPKVITPHTNTATNVVPVAVSSVATSNKESVLGYFGLSFNFGKSVTPPLKPVTPKPNDFFAVQERVLKLTYDYINPGLFRLAGYGRTNIKEAQELEDFCKSLKPAADVVEHIAAIAQVKKKLEDLKAGLEVKHEAKLKELKEKAGTKTEPGELLTRVTNFLNDDIWKIQEVQNTQAASTYTHM